MPTPKAPNDVTQILSERRRQLQSELKKVDQALKILGGPVTSAPGLTDAAREKLSQSMKRIWRERRAKEKTAKPKS